jgi:nucleoside 2-deoxyribosyltransferase
MSEQPKVFVIMPFDKEFDAIYEDLIKKPLIEAGYTVTRADSLLNQQNILQEIVRGVTTADLVVADLTANNPNVFYELGLAHALGIPTVLLAQSISDVPFDLRSYKVHVYETHFNQIKKLKEFLKKIGKEHLQKQITFRNPVTDFSQSEVGTSTTIQHTVTDGKGKVEADAAVKEWLDYLADAETGADDLNAILENLVRDNHMVTDKIRKHSAAMQVLGNNPVAGSARRFHKVSLLAASDINAFSKQVENQLEPLEDVIERVETNYLGLIQTVEPSSEQGHEGLLQLQKSLSAMLDSSKEAKKGIHVFRDAGLGLAERKISKDLSRAGRRLADALSSVISNMEKIEAFCLNALARIEQRLEIGPHTDTRSKGVESA